MPNESVYILSTRPLDASIVEDAANNKITIDSISFIRTEPIENETLKTQIQASFRQSANVIFTSMNAAEAVGAYIKDVKPRWNIYCLGTATNEVVSRHFPGSSILGEAENASVLADEIIKDGLQQVIFFCGDQRRDELPGKLSRQNIRVEEIVVYKTISTPEQVTRRYDGILFFSPSAVESLFSINAVPEETILFAIGNTTADCIRRYTSNKIIQSDQPGKKNLAAKAIDYFCTSNHTNEHVKK